MSHFKTNYTYSISVIVRLITVMLKRFTPTEYKYG